MAERANITPEVLKWARETAKMTQDVAAQKINVKTEKIIEWENGESKPTINQAMNLANKYQRPFAIFFLPEPPTDFQPLQDFRKKDSLELTTGTVFIIREIQKKQAWISETIQESEGEELSFVGKYSIKDNPTKVAKDILQTLSIEPPNYGDSTPLKKWIEKSEANGIFISRASFIHSHLKINKDEVQGFAIADKYAPFVFINSADFPAPQLFTLVHELAHIWTAQTGMSNYIEPEIKDRSKYHPVELFCNSVAANALMPDNVIAALPENTFNSSKNLFTVAKILGVSSFALLYRALKMNIISQTNYNSLKKESDKNYKEFLIRHALQKEKQKKREGGPSPYLMRLNRNSRLFTQIVLDRYNGGNIPPTLASSLLNVQSNKFNKLVERMYV